MTTNKKAPAKKAPAARVRRLPVGTLVRGHKVTRPDGVTFTTAGGLFVLDAVGTFVVDGKKVEAV